MKKNLKRVIKATVPGSVLRRIRPALYYGWNGDFKSWSDALQVCKGYDAANILEKVKSATLKVKHGEAVYERDSVLLESIEYSWPLLASLMWIAAKNQGKIRVLDFGGALGSSYFQNRKFFDDIIVQWNVVEQASFVKCGQQFIQDERIQFFYSIQDCIDANGVPDLVLISCTLPYLENPYQFLDSLMNYRIPHLVIDSTPFNFEQADRLTVQKVNPQIYEASYPCWFLNYNSIRSAVSKAYSIHTEFKNELSISLDDYEIQYQGLLAIIK